VAHWSQTRAGRAGQSTEAGSAMMARTAAEWERPCATAHRTGKCSIETARGTRARTQISAPHRGVVWASASDCLGAQAGPLWSIRAPIYLGDDCRTGYSRCLTRHSEPADDPLRAGPRQRLTVPAPRPGFQGAQQYQRSAGFPKCASAKLGEPRYCRQPHRARSARSMTRMDRVA
jgi:hypothetical protein